MSCSLCNYWHVKIQWIEMISPPLQINLSKNQIETVFLPRSAWACVCTQDNTARARQKRDFWQVIAGRTCRFCEASVLIPSVILQDWNLCKWSVLLPGWGWLLSWQKQCTSGCKWCIFVVLFLVRTPNKPAQKLCSAVPSQTVWWWVGGVRTGFGF